MAYRTEHNQRIAAKFDCAVELGVYTERRSADLRILDGTATVTLTTGAARLQTYLTAADLRALAYACLRAALDLDAIERENEVLPVGDAKEIAQ